ncbi:MAG: prolyl oligopeptidase family serine peptidase [Candidatus Glassbacteria bacterium]
MNTFFAGSGMIFRALIATGLMATIAGCGEKPSSPAAGNREASWPEEVREVQIVSSADGSLQKALFWAPADRRTPVPLLVNLHTWSGDYRQDMGIAFFQEARRRGWAFIHPDFRGPDRRPEAAGSPTATADILDAVAYAREAASLDSGRIYLAGVSGGGHMSLLTAGRNPEIWAGVSAWVPITDLARWHAECVARGLDYARDMEATCGGPPAAGAEVDSQYRLRSPLSVLGRAAAVAVEINTGIHDGHSGSVPVGHSLRGFNELARANGMPEKVIGEQAIERFETGERVPPELAGEREDDPAYGDKRVLFRRNAGPARVTVFESGHEGIPQAACEWLARHKK